MNLFRKKVVVDVRTWGQLGSLDQSQTEALAAMKQQVADVFDPQTDDDYRLLQFLRARKFDVGKTVALWREMKEWRRTYNTDGVLQAPLPHSDLISKHTPTCHHKYDKLGRPVYIEAVGYQDIKVLVKAYNVPLEELVRNHVRRLERQREVMAECSRRTGTRIGTVVSILDLQGATLKKNMSKFAREFAKQIAFIGQMYYPESLGKMFIVNAPSAFGTAWRFIKPFLDARTVNKIEVIKGNPASRLLEFIDADQLPVSFGGTCSCPGGCVPVDIAAMQAAPVLDDDEDDVIEDVGGGGDDGPPPPSDDYLQDIGTPNTPSSH